jgi:hypothetical protein
MRISKTLVEATCDLCGKTDFAGLGMLPADWIWMRRHDLLRTFDLCSNCRRGIEKVLEKKNGTREGDQIGEGEEAAAPGIGGV